MNNIENTSNTQNDLIIPAKTNSQKTKNSLTSQNNSQIIRPSVSQQVFMKTLSLDEFTPESSLRVKDFVCCLCKGIYNNPVFDECGHSFCKECIEKSMEIIDFCPTSHKQYTTKDFKKAVLLENLINKQTVFCVNKDLGCTWAGRLSARQVHAELECEKRVIACSGCNENGREYSGFPAQVKEHQENFCDFASVECEKKCGLYYKRIEKNLHANNCPKEFINCPLLCSKEILRENLEQHLNHECPLKVVSCGFKGFGCDAAYKRQEEPAHLDEYRFKHSKSLVFFLRNFEANFLNEKNEKIFEKLRKVEFSVKEKEKKIDERIEIVLKQLEEKRIKEEKLMKEREELEKELANARGLEDQDIKQEEEAETGVGAEANAVVGQNENKLQEFVMKGSQSNFDNKEKNLIESKQGENFKFDSENNFVVGDDVKGNKKENEFKEKLDTRNDGVNLKQDAMLMKEKSLNVADAAKQSDSCKFSLNTVFNEDNKNKNQEAISKKNNSAFGAEKSFSNKNKSAKKERTETAYSPNNSLNSNLVEGSKQPETPLTKRKRGRPSLNIIREGETQSKAKSEAFPHKNFIPQRGFEFEETPSFNSPPLLINFKNKENENLNNSNNLINEDSKSNLNSSEFSFNPGRNRKAEASFDSRGQAENLNLSLTSDITNTKSFASFNKSLNFNSNTNNNKNNLNNSISSVKSIKKDDYVSNSNNQTDYKREILQRSLPDTYKKDLTEPRKINAGDLFSKNIKGISSQRKPNIASKPISSALKDFTGKSKALNVDLNSPSPAAAKQQLRKLEILLSDEETEKNAQANAQAQAHGKKQYINVTAHDLDKMFLQEHETKELHNKNTNSALNKGDNDNQNNYVINNNSNGNTNSNYNYETSRIRNPSKEKITNVIKKRENEKKMIDDFMHNYSNYFGSKETQDDSEVSNFNTNSNPHSNPNSNSSSGQKQDLQGKSPKATQAEACKVSRSQEEIEERDRKLNFSGEESDFQMVSPQANKAAEAAKLPKGAGAKADRELEKEEKKSAQIVDLKEKIIENNAFEGGKEGNTMEIDSGMGNGKFGDLAECVWNNDNLGDCGKSDCEDNNNFGGNKDAESSNNGSSGFCNVNKADSVMSGEVENYEKNCSQKDNPNESSDKMDIELYYADKPNTKSVSYEKNKNELSKEKNFICKSKAQSKPDSMEVEINSDEIRKSNTAPSKPKNPNESLDSLEIQITSVELNSKLKEPREIKVSSSSQSSSAAKNSYLRSAEKGCKNLRSGENSAKKSEKTDKATKMPQHRAAETEEKQNLNSSSAEKTEGEVSIEIDSESKNPKEKSILCDKDQNKAKDGSAPNAISHQTLESDVSSNSNNNYETKENNIINSNSINNNKIEFEKISNFNNNNFNCNAFSNSHSNSNKTNYNNLPGIESLIFQNDQEEHEHPESFFFGTQSPMALSEQERDLQRKNSNFNYNCNAYLNVQTEKSKVKASSLNQAPSENYFLSSNNNSNFSNAISNNNNGNNNLKPMGNLNFSNYNNNKENIFSAFSPNTKTSNFSDCESKNSNSNATSSSKNSSSMRNPYLCSQKANSPPFAFLHSGGENNINNNALDDSSLESEALFVFDKINISQNFVLHSDNRISLTNNCENFGNYNNNFNSNYATSNQNNADCLVAMVDYPLKNPKKIYKWRIRILKITGWVAVGMCYKETIIANNYKFVYGKNLINNHGAFIFSLNGYRWNTSVKNEDNQKNSNFPKICVEENNEVILEYIPAMKMLIFNYGKYQAKLKYVNVEQGKTILPCVVMVNDDTEVEVEKL